jgi:hypothetical protein
MKILYKKTTGEIVETFEDGVKMTGLNDELALADIEPTDTTPENISECTLTISKLSKLAVLDALDALPEERTKFDILMQNTRFKERWDAATELDMTYPVTLEALEQVDMDIDAIKRKIIEGV